MRDWLTFSPRTKSIALLLTTLVLGIVLGGVLNAWWARDRFDRIRQMQRPGGLETVLMNTIEPTSPEQREAIQQVLADASQRVRQMRMRHRREVRATVDSLRADLLPLLTDEQKARLNERLRNRRQPPRVQRPGPPGRPPGGPPRPPRFRSPDGPSPMSDTVQGGR